MVAIRDYDEYWALRRQVGWLLGIPWDPTARAPSANATIRSLSMIGYAWQHFTIAGWTSLAAALTEALEAEDDDEQGDDGC